MALLKKSAHIKPEWLIALVMLVALIWMMVPVNFTGDTADGVMHYLFALTAPKHPRLFLDLWAKPVFTLVAAPFAQFGIQGMHFMNVICAVTGGLLTCATARRLNMKYGWLCFLFIIPVPVYFGQLFSAMTEPFFGLMLAWIIYLFAGKKYAAAALVASLLPFTRQEGFIIIPLLLFIYLLKGYYKLIPLLFAGTVFFSLLGLFFLNDLFFLISRHPYTGEALYGHGSFSHFFARSEAMFGFVVQAFLVVGLLFLFITSARKFSLKEGRKNILDNEMFLTEFLLISSFIVLFFMAHVVMWWKGIFSSLGLERVMACIVPAIALIALRGFNFIADFTEKKFGKKSVYILVTLVSILTLTILCTRSIFPPHENLSPEEKLLSEAARWLNSSREKSVKIYFSHPYNVLLYNINPKEGKDSEELMYTIGTNKINPGSYVVWDSNFGPNADHFPKERFTNDSTMRLLRSFGDKNFEVLIYRKK